MNSNPYPRREFLRRLGAGAVSALALAGGATVPMACAGSRDPLRGALGAFFDESERAGAVGAAYLEQAADEASVEALLALLFDPGVAEARARAESDPASLYRGLRSQHEADFVEGRVAHVDGWVLSLTEARVCAVVFLDAA